ncbi:MAG: carbohydrate ABC transporter permease [Clostridiales bacterium]|nr:carbohydrate ABC transporter permease [Clostridiales bacterium]
MVKRRIIKAIISAVMIILAIWMLMPIIITVLCSFGINIKYEIEPSISGYIEFYLWKPLYIKAYVRSVIIAASVMLGTVIISIPAAYVFAKVSFKGRNLLFYIYIIVMMMPFQVTLLPQYIVSKQTGLYDTLFAMILPGIFTPFSVFLLTQVIKSVPGDYLDAVRLDTSNIFVILSRIIIPIIRPGIICAAVLVFTEQWNMVAEPSILLDSKEKYPLALILSFSSSTGLVAFAATVMFMILPMFLFSFFENEIAEGLGEYRFK